MLKRVLIANRGEIALRIIGTARRLGIETVAVGSEPDLALPFARAADVVVPIGPGPAGESYLAADKIIAAARETGADAIHPGYGFLAENADFAEAVAAAGLVFVGPQPDAMRKLGGKAQAKAIAIAAGVPVVPGYHGEEQRPDILAGAARGVGYPVMIKAVAGGGGRGMRLVENEAEFAPLLASAQREAEAAFGDPRVLIEKVVAAPRHIEVQVFGDSHGDVVHLFERDCSLQRRNQKVIEEAPAPGMTRQLRAAMTAAAVELAKSVGYQGAGTVEFLVEGGGLGADAPWYFIEMNTRLQVEHPVTEAVTGLDLVEWQLRVAAGERLPLEQGEIVSAGHAVEARLCAEDAARGFLPSVGRIARFETPAGEGLRIDAGVETGSVISPFYDSMVAKLVAAGPDRAAAIDRLTRALEQTMVAGVKTNAAFLHALLVHPAFRRGEVDTGFIGRELAGLAPQGIDAHAVAHGVECLIRRRQDELEAQRLRLSPERHSPWAALDGFQLGPQRRQSLDVLVDGVRTAVEVRWDRSGPHVELPGGDAAPPAQRGQVSAVADGDRVLVLHDLRQTEIAWALRDGAMADEASAGSAIRAPINGRVAKVFLAEGAAVDKGQRIAVIEAMKMEHVLVAPRAGTIARIAVDEGQQVTEGALLAGLVDE
ncbi:MAG: ATP-grasp domain-containing protein [Hyphomicrobiaceae bacterium]|nr:ATP-grasp domain-containing protein [Hyphomicrobiaceae bacterium]